MASRQAMAGEVTPRRSQPLLLRETLQMTMSSWITMTIWMTRTLRAKRLKVRMRMSPTSIAPMAFPFLRDRLSAVRQVDLAVRREHVAPVVVVAVAVVALAKVAATRVVAETLAVRRANSQEDQPERVTFLRGPFYCWLSS